MNKLSSSGKQNGAALIIVLLLVATLSLISLAISEGTIQAARRASLARGGDAAEWLLVGVEGLAKTAIKQAMAASHGNLASSNPLIAAPFEAPVNGGSALIRIFDRTRCFNVNSLGAPPSATPQGQTKPPDSGDDFATILSTAGISESDAQDVAADIRDWIDSDGFQQPGGAEDGYYTIQPTPYRTGGGPIADISEIRAMAHVSRDEYRALRPYLCAQPQTGPSKINVNMLTDDDAPLLVGLVGDALSMSNARAIIERRPPGGYDSVDQFWEDAGFREIRVPDAAKAAAATFSRYLEVDALIRVQDFALDARMVFEVDGDGSARLLYRRFGGFD